MRIRSKTNRSYAWKISKFMVFLGVYSGSGGLELETTVKTKKNHQKPRKNTKTIAKIKKNKKKIRLPRKIGNSWLFLVFTVVLVVKSSKPL